MNKLKLDAIKYWIETNTEKGVTIIPNYMIQDLVMIATNNAIDKVDNAKKEKFGSMAQGLKL